MHLIRGSVITNVIRASGAIDVHVISQPRSRSTERRTRSRRRTTSRRSRGRRPVDARARGRCGRRSPWSRSSCPTAATPSTLPSDLLVLLLLVVVVAAIGGFVPAFVAAIVRVPVRQLVLHPAVPRVDDLRGQEPPRAGRLPARRRGGERARVDRRRAARRRRPARGPRPRRWRAQRHAHDRAGPAPAPGRAGAGRVRAESVGVLSRSPRCRLDRRAGVGPDGARRARGRRPRVPLSSRDVLVVRGAGLGPDDLDVLQAFTGQVALALQQRALRADAARAGDLEAANELRIALLAAVSHDLRTPLSSIKAAVTSLLQHDVDLTPAATRELLDTIDDETDRLNHLVGNLLDMSRLQTGALAARDARGRARGGRPGRARRASASAARVDADVPETLPRGPRRRGAARTRDRQRRRQRADVVATRRRACASRPCRRRSRRPPRRRPRPRDTAARNASRCSNRSNDSATARTTPESGSVSPSHVGSSRRWAARSRSTTRPAVA